jgi:hypothetical protein
LISFVVQIFKYYRYLQHLFKIYFDKKNYILKEVLVLYNISFLFTLFVTLQYLPVSARYEFIGQWGPHIRNNSSGQVGLSTREGLSDVSSRWASSSIFALMDHSDCHYFWQHHAFMTMAHVSITLNWFFSNRYALKLISIFWDITLCGKLKVIIRFWGTWRRYFPPKLGWISTYYRVLYPRRYNSPEPPPWEPQILHNLCFRISQGTQIYVLVFCVVLCFLCWQGLQMRVSLAQQQLHGSKYFLTSW